MSEPGAAALLARLGAGDDRSAWESLVERYQRLVFTCCWRLLRDPEAAADATQDAFIALRARAAAFAPRGDDPEVEATGWIARVACACAASRRRSEARLHRRERVAAEAEAEAEAASAGASELITRVREELAALPDKDRAALELRYLAGFDHRSVAAAIGTSEGAARVRVHRALETLRVRLARAGVASAAGGLAAALAAEAPAPAVAVVPFLASTMAGAALSAAPAVLVPAAAIGSLGWLTAAGAAAVLAVTVLCVQPWRHPAQRPAMDPPAALAASLPADEPAAEPAPVAEPPPPVVAEPPDGPVRQALDQPVTVDLRGPLRDEVEALALSLPPGRRVPIAFVCPIPGDREPAVDRPVVVDLAMDATPLRAVLAALCAQTGLRWRASSAGIVIDRAIGERAVRALADRFASAVKRLPEGVPLRKLPVDQQIPLFRVAGMIAENPDADSLRPVVRRLVEAKRDGEILVKCLGLTTIRGEDPAGVFLFAPAPVLLSADDPAVTGPLAEALKDANDPRMGGLLQLAFQLRSRAAVPACLEALASLLAQLDAASPADPAGSIPRFDEGALADLHPRAAIRVLGALREPAAVEPLVRLLAAKPVDARFAGSAMLALAGIGDERGMAPIRRILSEPVPGEEVPRLVAPHALALFGGDAALRALRRAAILGDPADRAVSQEAVRWLGRLRDAGSVDLLRGLAGWRHEAAVYQALAEVAGAAAVPRLAEVVRDSVDERDQRAALAALVRVRGAEATRALIDAIPDAADGMLDARLAALAARRDADAARALVAAAGAGRPARLRRSAAWHLAACGADGARAALRLAAETDDDEVRQAAIAGFAEESWCCGGRRIAVGADRALLPLAAVEAWFARDDAVVRGAAVGAVTSLVTAEVVDDELERALLAELARAWDGHRDNELDAFVRAAARTSDDAVITALGQVLARSGASSTRVLAIEALELVLSYRHDTHAREIIVAAWNGLGVAAGGDDRLVRLSATAALLSLKHGSDSVGRGVLAGEALAGIKTLDGGEGLRRALADADGRMRAAAARCVRFSGDGECQRQLAEAVQAQAGADDPATKELLGAFLGQIGGDAPIGFIDGLLAILAHGADPGMREVAAVYAANLCILNPGGAYGDAVLQRVADGLLAAAGADASPRQRAYAGFQLARFDKIFVQGGGSPELLRSRIQALRERIDRDPDQRVGGVVREVLEAADPSWINHEMPWKADPATSR